MRLINSKFKYKQSDKKYAQVDLSALWFDGGGDGVYYWL